MISSWLRRHRLALSVAAVFAGLLGNVWYQDGFEPFLILLAAVCGCLTVFVCVFGVTGYSVASHATREAAAIESGKHPAKELMSR